MNNRLLRIEAEEEKIEKELQERRYLSNLNKKNKIFVTANTGDKREVGKLNTDVRAESRLLKE